MTPAAVREYVDTLRPRYAAASRPTKQQILDEFCATTGRHRKSAIRALNAPAPAPAKRPGRPPSYDRYTVPLRPGKPFRIRSVWAQPPSNGSGAPVTGVMTR